MDKAFEGFMKRVVDERETNVVLYVLGMLDDLKKAGLVEGSPVDLTPKGREKYEALKCSNFEPTDEEVSFTMARLMKYAKEAERDASAGN
jgi:hypothetical protein